MCYFNCITVARNVTVGSLNWYYQRRLYLLKLTVGLGAQSVCTWTFLCRDFAFYKFSVGIRISSFVVGLSQISSILFLFSLQYSLQYQSYILPWISCVTMAIFLGCNEWHRFCRGVSDIDILIVIYFHIYGQKSELSTESTERRVYNRITCRLIRV